LRFSRFARNIGVVKRLTIAFAAALAAFADAPPGTQAVIDAAGAGEWRRLDPETTIYMELPHGRVVMELTTLFAPATVGNIKRLVRQGYFDGLSINRVQENYVVQWGDADGDNATTRRPLGRAAATITPEFEKGTAGLSIAAIPGPDGFADTVGFVNGFAVARKGERAWLTHCYGALGVGRGDTADSGNGSELYVVIGHAPRHLDRNITLAGRVIAGMEHLTSLPRGTGPLGFYEKAGERVPITRVRVGSDVPVTERLDVEIMRTEGDAFRRFVDARAHRTRDGWFLKDAGFIDLCNIRVPQRPAPKP
jgi:peptidylprolyl isomerase